MLIGFDFDNTIACYDRAITRLADDIFDLPDSVPRTKVGLRDYLRKQEREPEWTAFQGELYGPGMRYAEPFEGAIETMTHLKTCAHEMVIVSHRSLHPYAGPQYDLHQAAKEWITRCLQRHSLFTDDRIYFLETRDAKIATINQLGCDVFLDDLTEVLDTPNFPVDTLGVLFNPTADETPKVAKRLKISQWRQLPNLIK
jgi:hypothetical protein